MAASVPCPSASGSQGEDKKPAQKPSQGWDDQEQPRAKGLLRFGEKGRFSPWMLGVVTHHTVKGEVDDDLAGNVENDRSQPRDDSDDQG